MITHAKYTGYSQSKECIEYVGVWSQLLEKDFPMFFYDGSLHNIADVSLEDKDDLRIGTYNFTNENHVTPLASKFEADLRIVLKALFQETGRKSATFVFEPGMLKMLQQSDFKRFYPNFQLQDELFIFECNAEEGGFPDIFCMPKSSRQGLYINLLDVMALCSHELYVPATLETPFGRELTYILTQSKILGKFAPGSPDLNSVPFPTSGKIRIPTSLNTEKLQKVLDNLGLEKVTVIPPKEQTTAIVPVNPASFVGPPGNITDLEDKIVKDILDKSTVSLSDLCENGITETLQLLGSLEEPIEIFMDVPQVAKKMCLFQGSVFMIPFDTQLEPDEFFAEPIELFSMCTEENYPKKSNKKK